MCVIHVSLEAWGRRLEHGGDEPWIGGNDLRCDVSTERETENTEPCRIDISACTQPVSSGSERVAFDLVPMDRAAALPVAGPIEREHTESGCSEHRQLGKHVAAIGVGSMGQDDCSSIPGGYVPSRDRDAVACVESHSDEIRNSGFFGMKQSIGCWP